jgi:hypothetical protein
MSVVITLSDQGMDMPNSHCSGCDMNFALMWQNNPIYKQPEYCPFCGEDIEDYTYEREDDEGESESSVGVD